MIGDAFALFRGRFESERKMQKPTKVLLGLASVWPLVYTVLFIVFFFTTFLFRADPEGIQPAMAIILPLHLLTMLAVMALMVFYIVDIFRNNRVEKDKKALWAIVILMGGAIAMPIYWFIYFWKEPAVPNQPSPELLGGVNTSAWTNEVRASRHEEQQYVPPSQPPNWRE